MDDAKQNKRNVAINEKRISQLFITSKKYEKQITTIFEIVCDKRMIGFTKWKYISHDRIKI